MLTMITDHEDGKDVHKVLSGQPWVALLSALEPHHLGQGTHSFLTGMILTHPGNLFLATFSNTMCIVNFNSIILITSVIKPDYTNSSFYHNCGPLDLC